MTLVDVAPVDEIPAPSRQRGPAAKSSSAFQERCRTRRVSRVSTRHRMLLVDPATNAVVADIAP
jgi:hypothetical protein